MIGPSRGRRLAVGGEEVNVIGGEGRDRFGERHLFAAADAAEPPGFCGDTVPAWALTPVTMNMCEATRLPVTVAPLAPMITSAPAAKLLRSVDSMVDKDAADWLGAVY
jgi:hypothetical protein